MVGFLHIAEKIFTSIIEQTSYLHNFSSKAISICSLEKGINSSRKFFIKKGAPTWKSIQHSTYYNSLKNCI